jgi:hypothetical protein
VLNGAVVKTLLGNLPLDPAATTLGTAGQVTVLIRPEQIDLASAVAQPAADGVPGRVTSFGYHGHDAVLHVQPDRAADGRTIMVRIIGGPTSRRLPGHPPRPRPRLRLAQFRQVDVFTETPYFGNPVAVVLGADGLSDDQMRSFARWTNLSETTFVLAPRASGADYWVRIFTPARELPFAGHPTLGTCHAWLEAGGRPARAGQAVQECDAGLVTVRQTEAGLAFAAPPLVRGGPVEDAVTERVARSLNIARADIVDIQWADNGPGWVAVLLASAEAVLKRSGRARSTWRSASPGPTRTARRRRSRSARSARSSARRARIRSPAA